MPKKKINISYTRVSADIFHFGHLRLLQSAKNVADYHICGLYDDQLCYKWNGNLIMKYKERAAILEALSCVDEVLEQDELDPTNNLKYIHNRFPDSKIIFFQGHQKWKGLPGTNYVQSIGGETVKPDYYSRITRSSIKEELNNSKEIKSYDIENYLLLHGRNSLEFLHIILQDHNTNRQILCFQQNLVSSLLTKIFWIFYYIIYFETVNHHV